MINNMDHRASTTIPVRAALADQEKNLQNLVNDVCNDDRVACIIQKWKLSDLITFLVEGATQGVTYRSGVDITFGQVKTSLGNNILYYG